MIMIDRQARKQVLLTRIAFERSELARELAQVNRAARVPNLLRGLFGGSGVGRSLFGAGGRPGQAGWVGLALSLLRRYRVAVALLGGATPLLRGHGGRWGRRLLSLGGLAAAAWAGWRLVRGRDKPAR
jgi:hypothetical protein